jgi:short-subunit dehydrogenase
MAVLKTILITGATGGIGRHAGLHLARRGHRVFATGRRSEALDALARDAAGLPLETLLLDVTDPVSIEAARVEVETRTQGYGVDVLINNAGYGQFGPLELVSDTDLRRQFETNVFGLSAVTRAFVPRMRERGHGRLINVSSIGGRLTFPFGGAYHATKYAVEAMSDALRQELSMFGVEVVLIEPGPIATEFATTAVSSVGAMRDDDGPYGWLFQRVDSVQKQTEHLAASPDSTSRAIQRAVEARKPRARYVVPGYLAPLVSLLAMLPVAMLDWLSMRALGIGRRRARPQLLAAEAAVDAARG